MAQIAIHNHLFYETIIVLCLAYGISLELCDFFEWLSKYIKEFKRCH
jgi:hypothetical protein